MYDSDSDGIITLQGVGFHPERSIDKGDADTSWSDDKNEPDNKEDKDEEDKLPDPADKAAFNAWEGWITARAAAAEAREAAAPAYGRLTEI